MYRNDRALILSGGGARGAYEIGVWKHLCEMKWRPDLICGTSVGAINGAAITAGLPLEDLLMLWKSIERGRIFRIPIWRRILNFILRRGFMAYMDTGPLRSLLVSEIEIGNIRKSEIELVISAVNVLSSEIAYFNNSSIGIDHIMASSAIPVLFPWQYIGGKPYWDAGAMVNTPIAPAVEREAKEIIVVLLSPVGGADLPLPRNHREAAERLFEHSLIGSFEAFRTHLSEEQRNSGFLDILYRGISAKRKMKIVTVSPEKMLGFHSMLDFSKKQADELIQAGYEDARTQLKDFFELG